VEDRYNEMPEEELEDVARDRARIYECELVVEQRDEGWFAAFAQHEEAIGETVVRKAAEGAGDRRSALVSLLRGDDLTR
jgi:hypothetical protein